MKKLTKKLRRNKSDAPPAAPGRITSDNIAEHREEVLKGARKYIYPLQHSKHKLVVISITLFIVAFVAFFTYCVLALYQLKSTSDFLYRVTKVVPFPIARIGSDFVAYEDYLFEVQHYMHYYETQQKLDFDSDAGRQQLADFKKRTLEKVVNDAYVKKLAQQNNISVSNQEVDNQIRVVKNQNRLGGNDKEFEAVLRDYWGWSMNDFKRSLKNQILTQKVVSHLDTDTHDRANVALAQLKQGKDFAQLAREVSEDPATKDAGGEYSFLIDQNNRDISPKTVDALFRLKAGQHSEIVDTGYGLEIIKNIEDKNNQIKAAHIYFGFKDANQYINDLKDKEPTRTYIKP